MLKLTLSGKLNKDINMPVMGGLGNEELLSDKTKYFCLKTTPGTLIVQKQRFSISAILNLEESSNLAIWYLFRN